MNNTEEQQHSGCWYKSLSGFIITGELWAFILADGVGNGVTAVWFYSRADRRRPLILLYLWQRSTREEGTTGRGCSDRHHRHVAGSVARRKAVGRRATTRRIDPNVMP